MSARVLKMMLCRIFSCSAYFLILVIVNCIESLDQPSYIWGHVEEPYSWRELYSELPHSKNDDRCKDGSPEEREVSTTFGRIKGRTVTLCDGPELGTRQRPGKVGVFFPHKTINVFLGIPYAEPPTKENNLQFKPPRYPKPWNVINAVHYKPSCPQNALYLGIDKGINNTDEDCLYLNIFSPDGNNVKKYPVMIHIHGGNWDHGSGNLFPPHMLAATQEVVIVTFNYRLGHLGFLSTADDVSVGNYGLLDQMLALKWVYDNIGKFKGDPRAITLFGFDSGAAAASLLAISPRSRHMVQRVIVQNGSPVADWAVITDPLFVQNTSRILGEELGCTTDDSFRLLECIKKRSNSDIRRLQLKPRIGWLPWAPVVDNFTQDLKKMCFPRSPEELLQEENFPINRDFAYMSGVTRDEGGTILLSDPVLQRIGYRITRDVFTAKVLDFMKMYNYSINAHSMFSAISFMYTPARDNENETLLRQGYMDLLSDRFYKAPSFKTCKILLKKKIRTFMYVLNYTLEGYQPMHSWQGVSSEVEYLLLSGAPFMNPKFYPSNLNLNSAKWTEADRNMSYFYLQAWANFAKTGNPTPTRLFNTILWEPADEDKFVSLNLNATNTSTEMIWNYKSTESYFWNCYLPFLIGREPSTAIPSLEPGTEELRVLTSVLWGSVVTATIFLIAAVVCCLLFYRAQRYAVY